MTMIFNVNSYSWRTRTYPVLVSDTTSASTSTSTRWGRRPPPIICEVYCMDQERYPKLGAVKNEDGTFTGKPFEDMKPFLNRTEFNNEMIVKPI